MKIPYHILIFCTLALLPTFTGCTGEDHSEQAAAGEYYTCPMHPTVRSDRPGVCPVCNMTLVKASLIAQDTAPNTIQIVEEQQPLANIKTDTVKMGSINEGLVLLGTTAYNENNASVITSRSKGRIEKLVKRNPGETIRKGELLYTLYSEELLAAEKEYITALDQRDKYPNQDKAIEALLQAAHTRLLLAGLTEGQLKDLEKNRTVHASIPFYSETSGAILEIPVKEGEYVETGTVIYSVADLSALWVNAQLYSSELSVLPNTSAEVEIGGRKYKAAVELVTPSLEANTKINMVKFRIENKELELKPGMMATVQLKGRENQALVIPKNALIIGKMPMVWVKIGPELFESRMVKIGMETKQQVEILEGLKVGDILVTSGAYLVNSEFVLKKGATAQHRH
jgi:membrane fusion protein, copper/silver efflux system